jgi:hypothetical protein
LCCGKLPLGQDLVCSTLYLKPVLRGILKIEM